MAKDFKADTAIIAVGKKKLNVENSTHSKGKFYKDYFSLDTGKPIPLDQITKRIKKRFADIDRMSIFAMLDLFFVHENWNLYKKEGSFGNYLKEEVKISRTHGYGVLNSVSLLTDYLSSKGDKAPDLLSFIDEIANTINEIGVKKLIIIAAMKEEDRKFSLLDKLLRGEKITSDELLAIPKSKTTPKKVTLEVKDDILIYKDKEIIQFLSDDKGLQEYIKKHIGIYFVKKEL